MGAGRLGARFCVLSSRTQHGTRTSGSDDPMTMSRIHGLFPLPPESLCTSFAAFQCMNLSLLIPEQVLLASQIYATRTLS
jgi:hypothetical protein